MHYKHTPKTKCDWKLAIGKDELEPVVLNAVLRYLQKPDENFIDSTDDPDDLTAQQIEERERDLKSLAANWERAKDLAVRGSISADDLDKQRAKNLGQQAIIEDELRVLRVNRVEDEWSWMEPEMEQSQFENAESAHYFQYTEWADIIEAIDVQVDIFPDPEGIGWEPRITVLKAEEEREDVPQPGGHM